MGEDYSVKISMATMAVRGNRLLRASASSGRIVSVRPRGTVLQRGRYQVDVVGGKGAPTRGFNGRRWESAGAREISVRAENGEETSLEGMEGTVADAGSGGDEDGQAVMGKIFGSYLQLGVWICTLSFAGFTGFQKMQEDPSSVGMLIAPPAEALFLITTFLLYRLSTKDDD